MKKIWNGIGEYMRATDGWLLLLWLSASALSVVFLWGLYNSGLSYETKIISQLGAVAIGLVSALLISRFDYNDLLKLWKLYLPVCILLVLATFIVGTARGGDRAWLVIPVGSRSISIQPSELLKISFITTFSLHISKVEGEINSLKNMLLLCLHGGIHILLIQLQDSGTAMIFAIIFFVMLFCAGISWKYVLAAVAALAAATPLLWFKILTEYQKMRILIVFNPELDKDYYYQQLQSAIALGTGGIQGTGVFSGKHVAVPEVYNDFIFSFIGESSGFIGALGIFLLLIVIALKILYNSSRAKDTVGRFICIGMSAMITAQVFTNIGMCLGILPVIGVTLPLMSSGGSSVLSLYFGLGLVLSVYCHSNTALFYENR